MQERQRSWSAVRDWTSCRVQASFNASTVALEWAATASSAMAASTGCTRNAVGSSTWQKTLTADVHSARELHASWMGPQKEVQVGPHKLELVASFCYLGDMLSAASGCELSTTTRVKTTWKKFKDLLPVLSSRHLSFKTRGRVYSSCVRSAKLHASETWPLTKPNLQHLQRNDRAMIRQIYSVRPQDIVTTRSSELLVRLGIEDLDLILKERRLRWYGHVECSSGAVKTAFDIKVDGKRGPGRPKMTWKQLTERDCRKWKCCSCTFMLIKNPIMLMITWWLSHNWGFPFHLNRWIIDTSLNSWGMASFLHIIWSNSVIFFATGVPPAL